MEVADEYIHFDTEDESNKDGCSGAYPYVGARCVDFNLNFCYYSPKGQSPIDIPAVLGKK